jgi:4-amino-4-deoxy-L-arabinose transferase-like glycosyltransferase
MVVAALTFGVWGLDGLLGRDVALYAYAGQRVVEGEPPYVGVMNRAGPLAHLVPAAGVAVARWVGADDVTAMRVLFLVLGAACVAVAYQLGRDLFGSRPAGVVAAAAMIAWPSFGRYAAYGPHEKTVMVLFLLLALRAVVRRRWVTAGVFVSLATLTLQTAFFVGAAAAVVVILVDPGRRRLPALLRFGVGGLVPLAVVIAWFAWVGAFHEFLDAFLLVNRTYTIGTPVLEDPARVWQQVSAGYGPALWWLLAGLVVSVLLPLASWRTAGRTRRAALLGCAAATVAGVVWVLFQDFDSGGDTFPLLALAAVGLAGVADAVVRRLPVAGGRAVVAVLCALAVTSALTAAVQRRTVDLVEQRHSTAQATSVLPGATILSIEAPQPLVLAGLQNPTRHQMFAAGLEDYVDDTWPGGVRGFVQWIVLEEQPELVAVGRRAGSWVRRLRPGYEYVGEAPAWTWMARTSLGTATLARLRGALGGGTEPVPAADVPGQRTPRTGRIAAAPRSAQPPATAKSTL